MPDAMPEALAKELDGWGFGRGDGRGEFRLTGGGEALVYTDDSDADYVLATSDYDDNEMQGYARSFLAVVLDVMRWAAGEPQPTEEEQR